MLDRIFYFCSFFILSSLFLTPPSFADDAKVLPKGLWRAQLVSAFTYVEDRFSGTGESTSLGSGFSQTISPQFLAALKPEVKQLVTALNAMSPGLGDNLAIAQVDMELEANILTNLFALEYGVSDRLSVGLILPLVYASTSVKADSTPSAEFQQMLGKAPASLRPALLAMQNQTSIENLNTVLENDLGYSSGLESWSGSGLGDLEIGAKYNYVKSHPYRFTVKSGVRVPTGRKDDHNQLFDVAFGDDQLDLGFYHYSDYTLLSNLYFSHEIGYIVQLPHTSNYRVPVIDGVQISSVEASLKRDPGDYWETGLEMNYKPFELMTSSVKYRFFQKFRDEYSGEAGGLDVSRLATNSAQTLHQGQFQIGVSNIALVKRGSAKLPMEVLAFYYHPFAGENINQSKTVGLRLKSYF